MNNKFNLSAAAKLVSKKEIVSRKEAIFEELDSAIKTGVSTGQFDLSVGVFSIFVNKNSILLELTDADIAEYSESRGWRVEVERMVNIHVFTPTYKYIIDFGNENQFKELICVVDKKDVVVGALSSDGNIALDVAEIYLESGLMADNFDNFVFKIDNVEYQIEKKDTKGDFEEVTAKLIQ